MQTLLEAWSAQTKEIPSLEDIEALAKQIRGFKSIKVEVNIDLTPTNPHGTWISYPSKEYDDYGDCPNSERITITAKRSADSWEDPHFTLLYALFSIRCIELGSSIVGNLETNADWDEQDSWVILTMPYIHTGS